MESLIDVAVNVGLPYSIAKLFTLETVIGSAKLALLTNKDIKELNKKVISSGGTTEAAIKILNDAKVSNNIKKAFFESLNRANILSQEKQIRGE